MRFLVDEALSWRLARLLVQAGHDAVHVASIGLKATPDPLIFERARVEGRVILTQDIDFETLLLASGHPQPSVVLFRIRDGRTAHRCSLLLTHLLTIEQDLLRGAIVVFEDDAIRIHRLSSAAHPDSPPRE